MPEPSTVRSITMGIDIGATKVIAGSVDLGTGSVLHSE